MTGIKKDLRVGNKYAKKDITATATIHIRCTVEEKSKWVKAAQANGGLSEWVKNLLNQKS